MEYIREDLDRIQKLYDKMASNLRIKSEPGLSWSQTPFPDMEIEVFRVLSLLENKKLSEGKKILLAGSGDGRRAAYFNRLGFNVYLVELNNELIDISSRILNQLEREGIIDPEKMKILQGSFLDDKLYKTNGLKFSDFNKIYAYLLPTNLNGLVQKIESESPLETNLFFLSYPYFIMPQFKKLTEIDTKPLAKNSELYLNIYKKTI
jgi:hypothetical protein